MLINVLTYNISWATQVNKALGSEADFVEKCQKIYKKGGLQCTKNAIENIGKLPTLDLIGLQEVNSNIEEKIMSVQPNLIKFKRGKIGLSTVSTLWNPEIFGNLIYTKNLNLVKNDDRPCLVLVFRKDKQIFVIINMHMPWAEKRQEAIKTLQSFIDKNKMLKKYVFDDNTKIIMLGDFNDPKTTINKDNPIILKDNKKTIRLKYNKTKLQAKRTLKSCCWHKLKHKYKNFDDTGDYILVNKNVKQKSIIIPKIFMDGNLSSDHRAVLSVLDI